MLRACAYLLPLMCSRYFKEQHKEIFDLTAVVAFYETEALPTVLMRHLVVGF